MNFLTKEFEGLPDTMVAVMLRQLEDAIYRAHNITKFADGTTSETDYLLVCAIISGVVEQARQYKKLMAEMEEK